MTRGKKAMKSGSVAKQKSTKSKAQSNPPKPNNKRKSEDKSHGAKPAKKQKNSEERPPPRAPSTRRQWYPWFSLRPISRLWTSQYMKALIACSEPDEAESWYNVRVIDQPSSDGTLHVVIQALLATGVEVKEIVTMDLGWSRGEWMMKVPDNKKISGIKDHSYLFTGGFFKGGHSQAPEVEFIITPVSEVNDAHVNPVWIPVILMGVPFHDSTKIDLGHYLFEAITAQNKDLGIRKVRPQHRYHLGKAQTNDVRCELSIDPAFVHMWDFENHTKIVIQGWDNAGVPRPEMWQVSIRFLDECPTCGGSYHFVNGASIDCGVHAARDELLRRRVANVKNNRDFNKSGLEELVHTDPPPPTTLADSTSEVKTSIGFIVAT